MDVCPRREVVLRIAEATANASSASELLDPNPGRRDFLCFFFCI